MRQGSLVSMLVLALVTPGHAQRLTPPRLVSSPLPPQARQASAGSAVGAGIGLGLAGFLVGGLTGVAITHNCTGDEYCGLEGAFLGAAAGGTFGMALGVHLGNKRRGSFVLDFFTGAAVWGAGIAIASGSEWDNTTTTAAFVAIPIAQLVTTVLVERAVSRSRSAQRPATVSIVPRGTGGATLFATIRF